MGAALPGRHRAPGGWGRPGPALPVSGPGRPEARGLLGAEEAGPGPAQPCGGRAVLAAPGAPRPVVAAGGRAGREAAGAWSGSHRVLVRSRVRGVTRGLMASLPVPHAGAVCLLLAGCGLLLNE